MTYLDYIVFFEKCDRQQPKGFSGNATRLYLKLLALANDIGWPDSFARSNPYVAAVCNLAVNTMKDCRRELEAGGLIRAVDGGTGRNAATTYTLLKPSKIDGLPNEKPSNIDEFSTKSAVNPSTNPSNFDTLYIDKDNNTTSAADAAGVGASLPEKKRAGKKVKTAGATLEEIAALVLPHPSPEFAEAWALFYTQNTKQRGKPLTAFVLMLKKLAGRPEPFAVVMLEAAIQGNWSGVEHAGTPRLFEEWQREQARRPVAPPPAAAAPAHGVNEEFVHQQQAAAEAARSQRFAQYAAAALPEPHLATTP